MRLRTKMLRMAGLDNMSAQSSATLPVTDGRSLNAAESAPRPIDLDLALDLLERASAEMASVRAQAEAQRNTHSVLTAARQHVAAAGRLVSDLQEQLRQSEARAKQLAYELEDAEHRAASAARAEAQLAELQLAIAHGLPDGVLGPRVVGPRVVGPRVVGPRASARPKPISVRSSYGSHLTSDGSGREREQ